MKLGAQHSNSHNVEEILLHNKNIQQTIRLCLGGAFELTDGDLTHRLKALHEKCSRLFERFLPAAEQPAESELNESINIISSLRHQRPLVTRYVARVTIHETLGLPISSKDLQDISNPVCRGLRRAYAQDYQKPNVVLNHSSGTHNSPFLISLSLLSIFEVSIIGLTSHHIDKPRNALLLSLGILSRLQITR